MQKKYLRKFPLLLAALGLLGLSGCQTLDLGAALEHGGNLASAFTTTVSPEEEKQMGEESAALLLGAAPLVKNTSLQRYVNQVGQWVALQSGHPEIDWRFGVIETENVNAFAAPSGYIFVTKGLMMRLKNESELAGILAHEMGHVIQGHYVKTMLKQKKAQAVAGAASAFAANQGKGELGYLVNLSRGIYSSGLDKDDEFQADRMGVVLATRAGYDPFGLPRILQMYASSTGQGGFDLLFSTHPGADARLDKLSTAMGDKFDGINGVSTTTTFNRQMTTAFPITKKK